MAMILEVGMEPGIGQINVIVPMRHEPVCPHVQCRGVELVTESTTDFQLSLADLLRGVTVVGGF